MILGSWTVFLLHFQRIWCVGQSLWSSPSCFFSQRLGYQNMVIDPKAAFRTVRYPSGQDTRRKKTESMKCLSIVVHAPTHLFDPIWDKLIQSWTSDELRCGYVAVMMQVPPCDSGFFSRFGMDDGRGTQATEGNKNPGLNVMFWRFIRDAQDKDLWDELRNRWAVPPVLVVLGLRRLTEAAFAWHDYVWFTPTSRVFSAVWRYAFFLKTMETLFCLTHEDRRTSTNHIETDNSNRHTEREGEDHLHEAMFLSVWLKAEPCW